MSTSHQRLLVVSPVRNEVSHLEMVVRAMAAQTRRPDRWVIVDDGSTDGTTELLGSLVDEFPFISLLRGRDGLAQDAVRDRLAMAAAPKAFNRGLRSVDWQSFTHVAKLDGDTELPSNYFAELLARFAADRRIGIAGGVRSERTDDGWWLERPPRDYHVPGALKCYSIECFTSIGGMQERLGWDTIDEVYARMHGYRTESFPDLVATHHRPWGSADGSLRGRARHGRGAYIVGYPLPWVLARAPKAAQGVDAGVLSALVYVGGYLHAMLRRTPRVDDPAYRAFMRRELRSRVLGRIGRRSARYAADRSA